MENRIKVSLRLLTTDGDFLCHIDENEYESLDLLFDRIGMPNAGTIVWDKKNPMLGRKGVATQHEYVIYRAWDESPIYLRSPNVAIILKKAQSLIEQHGGITETVRRNFSKWISTFPDLTGGERAYRFINDDGRVYQSVAMGAPEPRTDPKIFCSSSSPYYQERLPSS